MYKNIRKKKNAIAPLQGQVKGVVSQRKRGRPKREHMKRYTIKMDKLLYDQVARRAEKIGTSNSFIIAEGVRMYFSSLN